MDCLIKKKSANFVISHFCISKNLLFFCMLPLTHPLVLFYIYFLFTVQLSNGNAVYENYYRQVRLALPVTSTLALLMYSQLNVVSHEKWLKKLLLIFFLGSWILETQAKYQLAMQPSFLRSLDCQTVHWGKWVTKKSSTCTKKKVQSCT